MRKDAELSEKLEAISMQLHHIAMQLRPQKTIQDDEPMEWEKCDVKGKAYKEAVEVIRKTKRASESQLQRKLGISFEHASQILALMEKRGIVSPKEGTAPRKIYMRKLPRK